STNMSSFGNMMIKDLREQVTAHPNINYKYVISIQGEADAAVNPHINAIAYYQNMKNFIAWVRGALDLPQLKWIIVGMHKDQNYYNQHIRNAQVKIAEEDPFTYFINPDSLTWIP